MVVHCSGVKIGSEYYQSWTTIDDRKFFSLVRGGIKYLISDKL